MCSPRFVLFVNSLKLLYLNKKPNSLPDFRMGKNRSHYGCSSSHLQEEDVQLVVWVKCVVQFMNKHKDLESTTDRGPCANSGSSNVKADPYRGRGGSIRIFLRPKMFAQAGI